MINVSRALSVVSQSRCPWKAAMIDKTALVPELQLAGMTLAGYHIEAGARDYPSFARAMIADMGDAVARYLRQW
jgi:hypothetical protein